MSPHLASFNKRKTRKFGKVGGSWGHAEPVAQTDMLTSPNVDDAKVKVEPDPWKRRVLIGSIVGSELAILFGLLASLARGSTDPRQSAWTLGTLSVALLALCLLRRKTLPAASDG